MKIRSYFFVVVLFLLPLVPARAQTFVGGGGALYHLPIGSLADRFRGALGATVYAGQTVSSTWTWVGKIDYVVLDKLNTDKISKRVLVENGSTSQEFVFPLPRLEMKLQATSFLAEARYGLFQAAPVEVGANIGFGFTYWEFTRNAYRDSLRAHLASDPPGTLTTLATLSVPESRQTDWSGTLNLGIEASVVLLPPVRLTVGAEYKMIIGELWQTLALDMESVSTMRFVTFRGGVTVVL